VIFESIKHHHPLAVYILYNQELSAPPPFLCGKLKKIVELQQDRFSVVMMKKP